MFNIDDTKNLMSSLGGDAVLTSVRKFPDQIEGAMQGMSRVSLPEEYCKVANIVFCGMGGSRFPGLIAYHLYKPLFTVPFELCDDYTLPGSVHKNTLVVLSSYSGTTEEVLHCAEEANRRGAKVAGFSVGGPLAQWLQDNSYPSYTFDKTHNPSGQPRMGFGYTLGSFLAILLKLGLLSNSEDLLLGIHADLAIVRETAKLFDVESKLSNNPAKQLAIKLQGRYPYLLVSQHLVGVGNCFQNQINETSKNISGYRVIPELNHHLMEGLRFPNEHKHMALFVSIESDLYEPLIQKRFAVTKTVIQNNGIEAIEHRVVSRSIFADVVELSMFASYVTMYLAGLYGVNPAEIPYVDYFKREMKKHI